MEPYPASAAVFRAEFNIEVPVGTRFSCEGLNFAVTERMSTTADTDTGLSHKVTCETAGAAANDYAGALIPIEYMDGLTHAELVELLIPGDDEEETETFRQRVLDSFQSQAFGGNQADYTEKVRALEGVSAVKADPVWEWGYKPLRPYPKRRCDSMVHGNNRHFGCGCCGLAHGGLYGGKPKAVDRWRLRQASHYGIQ